MESLEIDDSFKKTDTSSSFNYLFKGTFSSEMSMLNEKRKKFQIKYGYIYFVSFSTIFMLLISLIIFLANISKYKTTYKIV